jgi:predicted RNA-binding protein YlxR (DUF448 family)
MALKPRIAERTCCGCFSKRPVSELLAVTKLKDGLVKVNADNKLSGRSAYLCRNKFCLAKARARKGRDGLSFGLKVKVPDDIWKELEKLIGN